MSFAQVVDTDLLTQSQSLAPRLLEVVKLQKIRKLTSKEIHDLVEMAEFFRFGVFVMDPGCMRDYVQKLKDAAQIMMKKESIRILKNSNVMSSARGMGKRP